MLHLTLTNTLKKMHWEINNLKNIWYTFPTFFFKWTKRTLQFGTFESKINSYKYTYNYQRLFFIALHTFVWRNVHQQAEADREIWRRCCYYSQSSICQTVLYIAQYCLLTLSDAKIITFKPNETIKLLKLNL